MGARAADESFAAINAAIGPIRVTRVFYPRALPSRFTRGDIPGGVKLIVSYRQASPHTASYVKSIPAGADVEICYHHEPEMDYPSGAQFVREFDAQEDLIHHLNPAIPVAFIAGSGQWASPEAAQAFIPPHANRYYLDSYQRRKIVPLNKDPKVQNYLAALKARHHGFDGLSEYGRGLTSIADPKLAGERAAVIREDGGYLRSLGVRVWVYWFTQSKGSGLRWRFNDPASVAAWRAEAKES
jgi:hypothetical protein